jgi:hypothetical protein
MQSSNPQNIGYFLLESLYDAPGISVELGQKVTRGMDLNGAKGFSTGGSILLGHKTSSGAIQK